MTFSRWRNRNRTFLILFFRSALRAFQRHLFHGFQLEAVLEHHGHFVARTNRYHRVILFGTFDVVVTERLCGFRCAATDPHFQDITSPVSGCGTQPDSRLGGALHSLTDTVNKSRAPCPAEDFAVTHHHFALDTVFTPEADMPLNRHINGFAILQAADITGANNSTFTGDIPPGFQPHKTSRCVIRLAVRHFHQTGDTQLHRHRGFITGD
ncbi:Uncharacterised protein [Shigella sonnei]|nr:Uncharacterised protein [Shigella sonnei]